MVDCLVICISRELWKNDIGNGSNILPTDSCLNIRVLIIDKSDFHIGKFDCNNFVYVWIYENGDYEKFTLFKEKVGDIKIQRGCQSFFPPFFSLIAVIFGTKRPTFHLHCFYYFGHILYKYITVIYVSTLVGIFLFNIIVIPFPKAAPAMLTVVEIAAAVHMCMRDGTYGE